MSSGPILSPPGVINAAGLLVTPAGNLASTNVQAALEELQGDINTINGSSHAAVTLAAVGSSPNSSGASLSGQALTLQPASATQPGVLTSGNQEIGGVKTFKGSNTIIENYLDVPSIKSPTFLALESFLAGASNSSDFSFRTANARTNGNLLQVLNLNTELFKVDYTGKLFSGDLQCNNISVGGSGLILCRPAGGSIWMAGNRNAGDSSSDIYLSPAVVRSAGNIVEFWNGIPIGSISKDGMISAGVVGGGLNAPASFRDGSGSSGHVSLTCMSGLYTFITGQLPATIACDDGTQPYGGIHGDVSFGPTNAREAGWLLQALNGSALGGQTKWYVDYYGGMGTLAGLSLAQFGNPGLIPHNVIGGGTTYTGQAESTLMWANDQKRWYAASENSWKRIPFAGDSTAYDATDGSGTAGNQTINKLKGKGKFAAGASAVTITNNQVSANSHVSVVLQTNDATAILKNVVTASGSFTVNIVACTADTVFSFVVEN